MVISLDLNPYLHCDVIDLGQGVGESPYFTLIGSFPLVMVCDCDSLDPGAVPRNLSLQFLTVTISTSASLLCRFCLKRSLYRLVLASCLSL